MLWQINVQWGPMSRMKFNYFRILSLFPIKKKSTFSKYQKRTFVKIVQKVTFPMTFPQLYYK